MLRIPDCKIEKAIEIKSSRQYLSSPYFTGDALVATNGHILAYVPVEHDSSEDDVEPGHVPLDAIKHARKTRQLDVSTLENGSWVVAGVQFPREDLGKFPDYEQIVKTPCELADKDDSITVNLDAKLLYELAQAIGTNSKQPIVRLTFQKNGHGIDTKSPIHVKASSAPEGAYGLIMPCKF